MGWTGEYYRGDKASYIKNRLIPSLNHIVYYHVKGSQVYFAYDTGKKVIGGVILVEKVGQEYAHKIISESMLPFYYGANKKLLSMLSLTDCENSLTWRKTCMKKYNG